MMTYLRAKKCILPEIVSILRFWGRTRLSWPHITLPTIYGYFRIARYDGLFTCEKGVSYIKLCADGDFEVKHPLITANTHTRHICGLLRVIRVGVVSQDTKTYFQAKKCIIPETVPKMRFSIPNYPLWPQIPLAVTFTGIFGHSSRSRKSKVRWCSYVRKKYILPEILKSNLPLLKPNTPHHHTCEHFWVTQVAAEIRKWP